MDPNSLIRNQTRGWRRTRQSQMTMSELQARDYHGTQDQGKKKKVRLRASDAVFPYHQPADGRVSHQERCPDSTRCREKMFTSYMVTPGRDTTTPPSQLKRQKPSCWCPESPDRKIPPRGICSSGQQTAVSRAQLWTRGERFIIMAWCFY
ncbi:melanoma antigen recognized by T-cells 1 isoform X1 [Loxodonta africana]|uniref:melanoma antigen recognized by T-cells 1 isoform X1 n=1 Tax=Loxodonta africana TaxID=9785 RepID=UPI000C813459|nr:melanoma antigen recognized by T-cells 1 isoform X1 [Loxodonta africana]